MQNKLRYPTLQKIFEQLKSEQVQKLDVIVPNKNLKMNEQGLLTVAGYGKQVKGLNSVLKNAGVKQVAAGGEMLLTPTEICHSQIADKLSIPKPYYDRVLNDSPELLSQNVNHWMIRRAEKRENSFLRCFTSNDPNGIGYARAILSDSFKVIDNLDVLTVALEAIKETGAKVEIESCDLTDKKMYIRVYSPEVEVSAPDLLKNYRVPKSRNANINIRPGSTGICSGFVITNSEIGFGSFAVSPRVIILACANGMIDRRDQFRRVHLGSKLESGVVKWSNSTINKNMELIKSQVKDSVRTFLSKEYLGQWIDNITELGLQELEHPIEATQNVCKAIGYSEDKAKSILDYFVKSADHTAFGVTQAITFFAHETDSADEQFDMEHEATAILPMIKKYDVLTKN